MRFFNNFSVSRLSYFSLFFGRINVTITLEYKQDLAGFSTVSKLNKNIPDRYRTLWKSGGLPY